VTRERVDQLQRPDIDVHEPDDKVGESGEPGIESVGGSRLVEKLADACKLLARSCSLGDSSAMFCSKNSRNSSSVIVVLLAFGAGRG
jgi:hypothetical protein